MSLWRHLSHGIRSLTRRGETDREISDEVQHYLDQATVRHKERGLSTDQATRAARIEIGGPSQLAEEVRGYGWENLVETALADLRYAARRLRRTPGFTVLTVASLALGIGATTAIFSAVNPILFQSLPYPGASQIMMLWDHGQDDKPNPVTFGTYRELTARSRDFAALAVMKPWQATMTGTARPERFDGQRVSASYFTVLGVTPVLGRGFDASEDRVNGPNVVVLSEALWRRRFNADPAIIGQQVILNDNSVTILGVMPAGFENVLAPAAQLWAPLQYDASLPADGREWGHHLRLVGRLAAGASAEQAQREIRQIGQNPVPEFVRPRWAALDQGLIVTPLQEEVTRAVKPALLAVLGAVLLLLIIASVNVTNLLLARGAERQGEFALRAILGAGRGRVVRQLLIESVLLAILGGAAGIVVAEAGVRALVGLSPAELPRLGAIRVDGGALVVTLVVSIVVGLVSGLMPALNAARSDLAGRLQQNSRRSAGGHHATRRVLVIAEVALALVLLVGAGLLLRSLKQLFAVTPGFEPEGLVTMQVQASGHRFDDDAVTRRFFTDALAAVQRVPGVAAAAFTSQLPLSGDAEQYGLHAESRPVTDAAEDGSVFRFAVTPGYLQTMQIPLRRGRLLDARDQAGAPGSVLLSESLARRIFGDQDPIGQRVHVGSTDIPWYTVVGVVGDVKQISLAAGQANAAYITVDQWYSADQAMWLVARGRSNVLGLVPAIQSAIWSVDKDQPITRVAAMPALVAASAAERRFALALFEAFAAVALLLAAAGIYGILSGSVNERTREIGVRSALGANPRDIVNLILGQGMTLTAIGIGLGLIGAVAASQGLVTMLFGVTRLDPLTYAGVIALLVGVSALSCWVPAWRAARVDPVVTLRQE